MNILLVSPLPPPAGGDSTWTLKFMRYCSDVGRPVSVVNTAPIGKRAGNAGDKVSMVDEARRAAGIWRGILRSIRINRPNIVHFNSNCSPRGLVRDYISARILHAKKVPFILHLRCNVQDQIKESWYGVFFLRKTAALAAKVLVLNQNSLTYVDRLGIHNSHMIANFIESDYLRTVPKPILPEIGTAVYIGHVRKTKGIIELYAAAKEYPEIAFLVAGPIVDELENPCPANVHLLGEVGPGEVKNLLDKADIFLFPTYTEGFANALLEAMARGVPVIATDVGANASMLEKGGGILIKPRSVDDIVGAISMIKDKNKREPMSRWCVNKVKANYTIDKIMPQLLVIYQEAQG